MIGLDSDSDTDSGSSSGSSWEEGEEGGVGVEGDDDGGGKFFEVSQENVVFVVED